MEIQSVGNTSNSEVGLFSTLQARQRTEFGSENKDTIESSNQNKETWGACASRVLCFIPNVMWLCVKKVLCLFTCGLCCADKPTHEAMEKGVKEVIEVWKKADATEEEKTTAWNTFCKCIPGAKEEMIETFVNVRANACGGEKATEKEKEEWIKQNGEGCRKEAEQCFENRDSSVLERYLTKLQIEKSENENA